MSNLSYMSKNQRALFGYMILFYIGTTMSLTIGLLNFIPSYILAFIGLAFILLSIFGRHILLYKMGE